ncbi:MAG: polysaccharide deacetylase family protein [Oscillospiraceae bacterium]|jgi:polysaccharide deacetylase family sporulation protein PdaB|nr:polysaccharide deacetylase family protein [Oscillospiraceae bacterium]
MKLPTIKLPKIHIARPNLHLGRPSARRLILTIRRRKIAVACGILAVAAIFYVVTNPAVVGVSATKRELPIYSVQRDNRAVSLTFDAAWGNEDTQMLIDILGKYNVHATFFVVGAWAEKYPESVRALSEAGHEVMSHSNDHAHFTKLSPDQIVANISASNEKIAKVTGHTPTLFRAPYGEYDDRVITTVRGMGMNVIQWDVDSLDWKEISAKEITQRVTSKVAPGSIVLFHNSALHTPEALPSIIEYLIRDGYAIVPVSELLLRGEYSVNYTIDHAGRMIAK